MLGDSDDLLAWFWMKRYPRFQHRSLGLDRVSHHTRCTTRTTERQPRRKHEHLWDGHLHEHERLTGVGLGVIQTSRLFFFGLGIHFSSYDDGCVGVQKKERKSLGWGLHLLS